MRATDTVMLAARMIRSNILRTALTVLGVGVAIGLIVFLVGLGYGLQGVTVGSILKSGNLLSLDITPPTDNSAVLNANVMADIAKISGIKAVSPEVMSNGQVAFAGTHLAVAVTAVSANYAGMSGMSFDGGRMFADNANEIVLNAQAASLLNKDLLGQKLSLTYADPANQNSQIVTDGLLAVGLSNDASDVPTVYVPYKLLTEAGQQKISTVKAMAVDARAVTSAQATIVKMGFQVDTLSDSLAQAQNVFRWITMILAAFGLIATVVAAIGMFNTLTIALLERTKEYGIMKTIGVADSSISLLFLTESALIGLGGGLAGIGIGIGAQTLVEFGFRKLVEMYGGEAISLFANPALLLGLMLAFPVILAVLTAIYPAMRASKINPLDALRYE